MRVFSCGNCGQAVYFENISCENCGTALGFDPEALTMRTLTSDGDSLMVTVSASGGSKAYCANHANNICNWLVSVTKEGGLCTSCELNQTIPGLSVAGNLEHWFEIEKAKRRLIYTLRKLGLPLQRPPGNSSTVQLAFDIVANAHTGHENGLITINIAEADPAARERAREQMNEPYRTLLGHFRHEIGHYYWLILVADNGGPIEEFRELFGDEREDYAAALAAYHENGPKADWPKNYISAYATAHPWEDWAESWAHYLHIIDTLETAEDYRLESRLPNQRRSSWSWFSASRDPFSAKSATQLIDRWMPLGLAMNSLNRSMGLPDFYPFVIPPAAVSKLEFIHRLIEKARC